MLASRALLAVLGELRGGVDPAGQLTRDLYLISADMNAAVADLERSQAEDSARIARARRLRALRQLIKTLGSLESQWERES